MRSLVIGALLASSGVLATQPEFTPPIPTTAALDQNGITAEYRRLFDARGVSPNWTARIELGKVRIRIEQQPEKSIPLLTPYNCIAVRCEGVMIEQAVAHRHHGVSIIKEPCNLAGSDRTYAYSVSVSVLRSPDDTQGVSYRGCGWPATP